MKNVLPWFAGYMLAGIATAGYSAYLFQAGKPHFKGIAGTEGSAVVLLEAVALWPYALYVNIAG